MSVSFQGVKHFSTQEFEKYKSLFEDLSNKQEPHTLFIGCSDSRVVPNLITTAMPGDLFVVRNIANVVPPYRASSEFLATTSAVEYAVLVLNVENIVVCGHSNCGGCKSLLVDESELSQTPHTKKWLELVQNAKSRALYNVVDPNNMDEVLLLTEQENIVEQMNHLLTYPFIEERYKNKAINIFGWYYELNSGKVYNYNKDTKIFEPIE